MELKREVKEELALGKIVSEDGIKISLCLFNNTHVNIA